MSELKPSPAFQLYPADFLVSTAEMLPDEVGGYIRLLCYSWTNNGLPNDDRKLKHMSGVHDPESFQVIRSKFKIGENGKLVNKKQEEIRSERDEYRQKQSENAKKRWKKNDATALPTHMPNDMPNDMPNECSSSSSSSISLTTPTTSKKNIVEEKSKRFVPPTYKLIEEYCLERKNQVEPQRFLDHYTSNGWMVGKNKMKEWKAAVRTWEKNSNNFNNLSSGKREPITAQQRDQQKFDWIRSEPEENH